MMYKMPFVSVRAFLEHNQKKDMMEFGTFEGASGSTKIYISYRNIWSSMVIEVRLIKRYFV